MRQGGHSNPDNSGFITWVKDPHPSKSDTGSGDYKEQALPSPPWSRSKPTGKPMYNGPGPSGTGLDGRTVHEDMARTQPEPGKEHPHEPARTTPQRRPGLTADMDLAAIEDDAIRSSFEVDAAMYGKPYPGVDRQHGQKGEAKRDSLQDYKRHKKKKLREMRVWYRRNKVKGPYKREQTRRDKANPSIYKRRPGGGYTRPKDRTKDWREEQKKLPESQRADSMKPKSKAGFDIWKEALYVQMRRKPDRRQRRQKGRDKFLSKQYYRKNRMKARLQSKRRRKKLKNNPVHKKNQAFRRKHPERFKRRLAQVLTAPDIAFSIGQDLELGYVHGVSPMTGAVTFYRSIPNKNVATIESLPVMSFLASVAFLTDEDEDAMFQLINAEVGEEAYLGMVPDDLRASGVLVGIDCDSPEFRRLCGVMFGTFSVDDLDEDQLFEIDSQVVNQDVYGSDFPDEVAPRDAPTPADPYMIDPSDDDFIYGVVNRVEDARISRVAELYYEKMPPEMEVGTFYDRANDHDDRQRLYRTPADTLPDVVVDDNPGSAKVIPYGKGFVFREATRIPDIRDQCGPELLNRSKGLPLKLRRASPSQGLWLFDVKGSKGPYRVRLKATAKGNIKSLSKTDVKVSCSCPFWQYQGPEYWAKTGDYLFGRPRGEATEPTTRDPQGRNRVCKHVLAVFHHVLSNDWSLPSRGRRASADLRYLANRIVLGEVEFVADPRVERVAKRYLVSRRRRDA